jgi:hypothetical protein
MAQYQYKAAEQGIVGKLNAIADYNAAFPMALNYMTQGALSPEGFSLWNGERTSKLGGGGNGKLTLKVSRKGAISLYGMGRWPLTLYVEQWEKLFTAEFQKTFADFVASDPTENHPATAAKGDVPAQPAVTAKIQRKGAAVSA